MRRALVLLMLLAVPLAACSGADDDDRTGALGTGVVTLSDHLERHAGTSPDIELIVPPGEAQTPTTVEVDLAGLTRGRVGVVEDLAVLTYVTVDEPCVPAGEHYAESAHHRATGPAGRTELDLAPGTHTLCAQATDGWGTVIDLTDEATLTIAPPSFRLAPLGG